MKSNKIIPDLTRSGRFKLDLTKSDQIRLDLEKFKLNSIRLDEENIPLVF